MSLSSSSDEEGEWGLRGSVMESLPWGLLVELLTLVPVRARRAMAATCRTLRRLCNDEVLLWRHVRLCVTRTRQLNLLLGHRQAVAITDLELVWALPCSEPEPRGSGWALAGLRSLAIEQLGGECSGAVSGRLGRTARAFVRLVLSGAPQLTELRLPPTLIGDCELVRCAAANARLRVWDCGPGCAEDFCAALSDCARGGNGASVSIERCWIDGAALHDASAPLPRLRVVLRDAEDARSTAPERSMRWETLPALEELRVVPSAQHSSDSHRIDASPISRACMALRAISGVPFSLDRVPQGALERLEDVALLASDVWRVAMLPSVQRVELHATPQAPGGAAWARREGAPPPVLDTLCGSAPSSMRELCLVTTRLPTTATWIMRGWDDDAASAAWGARRRPLGALRRIDGDAWSAALALCRWSAEELVLRCEGLPSLAVAGGVAKALGQVALQDSPLRVLELHVDDCLSHADWVALGEAKPGSVSGVLRLGAKTLMGAKGQTSLMALTRLLSRASVRNVVVRVPIAVGITLRCILHSSAVPVRFISDTSHAYAICE